MIKAVVFDLDNTIYDYDFCHKKAMAELERYACHAFRISADSFVTAFDQDGSQGIIGRYRCVP